MAGAILYTDERRQEITSLYRAGLSALRIGERFGMSKGKVSGILGRAGVKKDPREVVIKPVVSKEMQAARRASALAAQMRAAEIAQQRAVAEARESAYQAARPPRAVSSGGGHTCLYPMWRHGERPGPKPRYCDAAVALGEVYCREHWALCYHKATGMSVPV